MKKERHLGGFERIIGGEGHSQIKNPPIIRRIRRAKNGGHPLIDFFSTETGGAVTGRVFGYVSEFFLKSVGKKKQKERVDVKNKFC